MGKGIPGWCPSPKPTNFDVDIESSSSDDCMLTPEGVKAKDIASPPSGTVRQLVETVAASASPVLPSRQAPAHTLTPSTLKEDQNIKMKRTPQPNLTQSKLTSLLQPQPRAEQPPVEPPAGATSSQRIVSLQEVEMDTSAAPAVCPPVAAGAPPGGGTNVTTDFLLKALRENSEHLIKSFNASLSAVSQRVADNTAGIAANTAAISHHASISEKQQEEIRSLTDRVKTLERGPSVSQCQLEERATLGPGYLLARRSIRLWPVRGASSDELWGNVGEFLHETLAICGSDIGQEDIESIDRTNEGRGQPERDEVIVTFYDKLKRDLVVANSPALASMVDAEGRPTAGIRLEVPPELADTFRLLSRFGSRLRARHGVWTKRHIKFDDFTGSMYSNVKLPGDENWTKVTVAMAKEDLAASMHEENTHTGGQTRHYTREE